MCEYGLPKPATSRSHYLWWLKGIYSMVPSMLIYLRYWVWLATSLLGGGYMLWEDICNCSVVLFICPGKSINLPVF